MLQTIQRPTDPGINQKPIPSNSNLEKQSYATIEATRNTLKDLGVQVITPATDLKIIPHASSTTGITAIKFGRDPRPNSRKANPDGSVVVVRSDISLVPVLRDDQLSKVSRQVFLLKINKLSGCAKIKALSELNVVKIIRSGKVPSLETLKPGTIATLQAGDIVQVYLHENSKKPIFEYIPNSRSPEVAEIPIQVVPYSGQEFISQQRSTLNEFVEKYPEYGAHPYIEYIESPVSLTQHNRNEVQLKLNEINANKNTGYIICPTRIDASLDLLAHKILIEQSGVSSIPIEYNPEKYTQLYNNVHQPVRMATLGLNNITYCHCGNAGDQWNIVCNNSDKPILTIDYTKEGKDSIRVIEPEKVAVFKGTCLVQSLVSKNGIYSYIKLSQNTHRHYSDKDEARILEKTGFTSEEIEQMAKDVPTNELFDPASANPTISQIFSEQKTQELIQQAKLEHDLAEAPIERPAPTEASSHGVVISDIAGFKIWRERTALSPLSVTELFSGINTLLECSKLFITQYYKMPGIKNGGPKFDGDGAFASWKCDNSYLTKDKSEKERLQFRFNNLSKLFTASYLHKIAFAYITGSIAEEKFNSILNNNLVIKSFFEVNKALIKSSRINYKTILRFFPGIPQLSIRHGVCAGVDQVQEITGNYNYVTDPRASIIAKAKEEKLYGSSFTPVQLLTKGDAAQAAGKSRYIPKDEKEMYDLGISSPDYQTYKETVISLARIIGGENLVSEVESIINGFESKYYIRDPTCVIGLGSSKGNETTQDAVIFNAERAYGLACDISDLFSKYVQN